MVYVDDGIFLGDNDSKLQDAIRDIQDVGLNIEDQGHPAEYVGFNIKKTKDGSYEFTQCALIDSIIEDVGLKDAKVKPDPTKGFKCYCDSDFSGLWNKEFAPVDPSTAKSRSGWVILYAGCPVSWASKLQSQVALSTTKAEYIAMSQDYATSFQS